MILKEIDVAGFKSFADKTAIKFDSGFTAIVGPNGCGKSNVADAIRWVLGEQSAKLLRCKNMEDVIFKGTEQRKSLSYCEVALVFDNSQHTFNVNFDEVVVSRKLNRSGESCYLLNGNECRLKDINDLLHDSGVGGEGYSIIGQGRVQELIDSKPQDRRAIFEEAAGISKFKERKKDTENKLQRANESLNGSQIIIDELEKQIGPLKKQSEDAKVYLELRDNLKFNEINSYISQYESTSSIKSNINEIIKGLDEEMALRQSDLDKLSNQYNNNLNEMNNADKKIDAINTNILDLTLGLEKITGESNITRERIKFLEEQNDRIKNDIQKLTDENKSKTENLTEDKQKVEEQGKQIQDLKVKDEELSNKYLKVVDELTQSEGETQSSQDSMINALDKLSDIKANLSKLKTERDNLNSLILTDNTKIEFLNKKIAENQTLLDKLNQDLKDVDNIKLTLSNTISENQTKFNGADALIKQTQAEFSELVTRKNVLENRKNLITEMKADFEGYAYGVKNLLKDSKNDNNLKAKIMGVVADLVKVPQKYETAIEMALGNAVQNIVTKNEDDTKDLINHLKQNNLGRVTFLPLTSFKSRSIDNSVLPYLNREGVCGIACDLVSFDAKYTQIFKGLLGATIIVNDINSAASLAKLINYSVRIVTLDGDVINPAGSYTGGSKKSEISSFLSRDREIEDITKTLTNIYADIETKRKLLDDTQKVYQNSYDIINQKNRELKEIEVNNASAFEKRNNFEVLINSTKEEIDSIRNEINDSNTKIKNIDEQINSVDELENTVNSSRQNADKSIQARRVAFNKLKEQRDSYNVEVTQIKMQIVSLEGDITALNTEIERLSKEIADNSSLLDVHNVDYSKNEIAINSMIEAVSKVKDNQEVISKQQKLDEARKEKASCDNLKQVLQESLKNIEISKNQVLAKLSDLKDKKYKQEMMIQKVDIDLESMQKRVNEEYSLTYETCLPFKKEGFNLDDGLKEVSRLKKEISKLGSVNVNAIEDYKLVSGRYDETLEKVEDIKTAINELNQIITDLSNQMTTRFDTEFKKINTYFVETFRELFGGGDARLELLPSEDGDPLNAGVDIIAQLPGRKLQSLTLFSGGEKTLIAIAILFAILRLRPMPFCFLDEIEAALDDANIERFASYLKRFAKRTQFICITHRKPTMELADNLYGVTMEEKGVSKVVSVKLADAIKGEGEGIGA